jgi:hypothetical protein
MEPKIPAYFRISALYQQMARTAKEYSVRKTEVSGDKYASQSTENTSYRLREPIVVTQTGLVHLCTRNEWYIIGLIMDQMFEYNAIWHADGALKKRNTQYKIGIAGLVRKEILFITETSHYYVVNPMYLRRGDPFAVAATTANMLMNRKPNTDMLMDKRPVGSYDFSRALKPIDMD